MTLNDLEGQRSFSQNDLYNMNVQCTKFDVSMLFSFEVIDNYSRLFSPVSSDGRTEKPSHRGALLLTRLISIFLVFPPGAVVSFQSVRRTEITVLNSCSYFFTRPHKMCIQLFLFMMPHIKFAFDSFFSKNIRERERERETDR